MRCRILLLAGASVLLSCQSSETRQAKLLWEYMRDEGVSTTRHFLAASVQRDSVSLTRLASDSVATEILRHHASALPRIRAAAAANRLRIAEIGPCSVRVDFEYAVEGVPMTGGTLVERVEGVWKVTALYLLIE